MQVVARSVETALHKLHELEFDLRSIVSGVGTAPLPPIAADDLTALGWTNDSVLYGGAGRLSSLTVRMRQSPTSVHRFPVAAAMILGLRFWRRLSGTTATSTKLTNGLFSPAVVIFNNVRTGRVFSFGDRRDDVLQNSWQLS